MEEGEYEPEEGEAEEMYEDEEIDLIQKKIQAIEKLCSGGKGSYGDTDFPPNDESLYIDPLSPPDYSEKHPLVEWIRPQETFKDPKKDEDLISMIKHDATPGDVKQGDLGDCWFLGAICTLATRAELLKNLFVYESLKYGFCVFRFFKNGEWQYVFIDTRLPYNKDSKTPLYAKCAD